MVSSNYISDERIRPCTAMVAKGLIMACLTGFQVIFIAFVWDAQVLGDVVLDSEGNPFDDTNLEIQQLNYFKYVAWGISFLLLFAQTIDAAYQDLAVLSLAMYREADFNGWRFDDDVNLCQGIFWGVAMVTFGPILFLIVGPIQAASEEGVITGIRVIAEGLISAAILYSNLLLFPTSFYLIGTSDTFRDVFVNVVAVQIFTSLDEIFMRQIFRPDLSVKFTLESYVLPPSGRSSHMKKLQGMTGAEP